MGFLDIFYPLTVIITNVFIIVGVFVAYRSISLDHDRRKKQSTIEFYDKIWEKFYPLLKIIDKKPQGVLNVEDIDGDAELQELIREYLSIMERFSVGVNTGVYDIYVLNRMSGFRTINSYEKLGQYIKNSRTTNPNGYKDFEEVVDWLKEIRKKPPSPEERKANIKKRVVYKNSFL